MKPCYMSCRNIVVKKAMNSFQGYIFEQSLTFNMPNSAYLLLNLNPGYIKNLKEIEYRFYLAL
jgi:hypothetical protein